MMPKMDARAVALEALLRRNEQKLFQYYFK